MSANTNLAKDYTNAQIKAGLNLLRRLKARSEDACKTKPSDYLKGRISGLESAISSLECLGLSPEVDAPAIEHELTVIGSASDTWKSPNPGHYARKR